MFRYSSFRLSFRMNQMLRRNVERNVFPNPLFEMIEIYFILDHKNSCLVDLNLKVLFKVLAYFLNPPYPSNSRYWPSRPSRTPAPVCLKRLGIYGDGRKTLVTGQETILSTISPSKEVLSLVLARQLGVTVSRSRCSESSSTATSQSLFPLSPTMMKFSCLLMAATPRVFSAMLVSPTTLRS